MHRARRRSILTSLPALAALAIAGPGTAQTPDTVTGPPTTPNADLTRVDAHVAATPASAETSVAALADYLAAAGPGDAERARAIFRWITANIAYDVAGYSLSAYADLSASGILRRRTAVCTGYARLARALGQAMGLEVAVVHGWSKGWGYRVGDALGEASRHSWNAVRIDGVWALMDPTWGAGYVDDDGRFVRRDQDHYFLTDPSAFILDHFPEEPRWQLLEEPVTRQAFKSMVYLRPRFFALGLELKSHRRGRIAVEDRATVKLGTPGDVAITAALLHADDEREVPGRRTRVRQAAGTARIDAVVPRPGAYLLRLFAKPRGDPGPYHWAADYRLDAADGDEDGGFR